jgi:hypothetical protein
VILSIGAVTCEAKKKRKNLLRNLHRRRKKNIFFIYEVFVKQKKEKSSANHYLAIPREAGRRQAGLRHAPAPKHDTNILNLQVFSKSPTSWTASSHSSSSAAIFVQIHSSPQHLPLTRWEVVFTGLGVV